MIQKIHFVSISCHNFNDLIKDITKSFTFEFGLIYNQLRPYFKTKEYALQSIDFMYFYFTNGWIWTKVFST